MALWRPTRSRLMNLWSAKRWPKKRRPWTSIKRAPIHFSARQRRRQLRPFPQQVQNILIKWLARFSCSIPKFFSGGSTATAATTPAHPGFVRQRRGRWVFSHYAVCLRFLAQGVGRSAPVGGQSVCDAHRCGTSHSRHAGSIAGRLLGHGHFTERFWRPLRHGQFVRERFRRLG